MRDRMARAGHMTDFATFRSLMGKGNVLPVVETLLADTETPVSVYRKIRGRSPYSFLLESVEGGETIGRYSILGCDPFMKFTIDGDGFDLETFHDDVVVLPKLVEGSRNPLEALGRLFAHIRTAPLEGLPRFIGGAVGYVGYETAGLIENIPRLPKSDPDIPDSVFLFYDVVVIFDNVLHKLFLISLAYLPELRVSDEVLRREYEKAVGEIVRLKELLMRQPIVQRAAVQKNDAGVEYALTKDEYCRRVIRAREYIQAGDIFQVVLSQQLKKQTRSDSFDVYRMLRVVNPSPYMYYLSFGTFEILGASPEMLVRMERGQIETRPIAGTRRRGALPEEDLALEQELRSDAKEKAEHLMLVDLGRNDLGRICEYGSVEVTAFMTVERYSHVMHLVSSVRGRLRSGVSPVEALLSCFPAGTLTGAPKIRAMEIIAELEPVRRGVYGGAVAYLDFSGNLDSCIAIRTIVAREGMLYFQAGAGIVFDSVPEREYEETLAKLAATLAAVEMLET